MKKNSFYLFTSFFLLLFFIGCTPSYSSELVKVSALSFKPASFLLNEMSDEMQSKGELLFKGEENGSADYEIYYTYPANYRIELYGPFHISAASFIMKDNKSFTLIRSNWEEIDWSHFIIQNMGTDIPIEIFNIVLGYKYNFDGECAKYLDDKNVCVTGDIFFLMKRGKVKEIMYKDFVFVHKKGVWHGESGKSVIEIENSKTVKKKNRPEIFKTGRSTGYFDDI